ncbi:MAG: glycosyltransferase family 39 protein [Bacteroidota bacterium]
MSTNAALTPWYRNPWVGGVLLGWLILNLLQSTFTELFHDEAYYWMFSRHLAWGYAEHAPMVALVIRIGTMLAPGELGVRLIVVLLNVGTLFLVWGMTDRKKPWLFWMLLLTMVEVHVGGFLAVPDAPLVFFVSLFLYRYQRWLKNENWLNTLWLTLAIIGIVYSKYHGVMVLFFTLLSNLRLLRNKYFWTMAIVATLAWFPHLTWLIETKFATFQYHLLDRIREPHPIEFSLNYLLNQLLVAGPFMGFVLFPSAFKKKPKDEFERALKWILFGVLGFLFLLSFRTHIEANWSASAFFPLVLLSYGYIAERQNWQVWTRRLFIPSVIIILLLRVYLMVDFLPFLKQVRNEFHYWPEWAAGVSEVVGERPAVFINGYQHPSKYMFYSGKEAWVTNNFGYHKTQYDQWDFMEDAIQGKDICLISRGPFAGSDTLFAEGGLNMYYRYLADFHTYNRIDIEVLTDDIRVRQGDTLTVPIKLQSRYPEPKRFVESNPEFIPNVSYHIYRYDQRNKSGWIKPSLGGKVIVDSMLMDAAIVADVEEPGDYFLLFSITQGWYHSGYNGRFEPIEILAPTAPLQTSFLYPREDQK